MRHIQHRFAVGAGRCYEQAGGHERVRDPALGRIKGAGPHPPARRRAIGEGNEPEQGCHHRTVRVRGTQFGRHPVRLPPQRAGDPVHCRVVSPGHYPAPPGVQVQLLQGEGEQRQGLAAPGSSTISCTSSGGSKRRPAWAAGPAITSNSAVRLSAPTVTGIAEQPGMGGRQEGGQEFRPHDQQHPQLLVGLQRALQQPQELLPFTLTRQCQQLLSLVNDD